MNRSPLVVELEDAASQLIDFFGALDPRIHDQPITPSEHPGGRSWSAKDHLAHLVQRELNFLPIARRVIGGEPDPLRLDHRGATPAERSAFVNRENQAAVDKHQGDNLGELLAEFAALRSELVMLVAPLTDSELQRPVHIAPGRDPSTGEILSSSRRHAAAHVDIVARALGPLM